MIPSFPSTAQFVIEGQVFKGAAKDYAEGLIPNIERASSLESPCPQPSKEGPASTTAIVELTVALTEELVERTLIVEEVEPELVTILDLTVEKTTAPVSSLPIASLPAAEMVMVMELRAEEENPCAPTKRGEHQAHGEEPFFATIGPPHF